ncbi:Pyridine nucleotide-disulfide oxidoreductase, FAD/NAD(P)-binding domain protein [Kalmanozyma brasiliensis GHG001]|uniref:NADH:ubiquinone reductase (non-electrogenic) n=1 Tax=Kalmanozyma brasiliensis (strain GHG001) TaxID=1365824 RepID=V5EJ69_KALBG|nr:Pyridine nucleotide-disulfide oxidoreductase, FAD/NAD(P)-binding domain protein [Kalmanozyma brasiliensis GHG001]EST04775.1 Pyridine nucleotide-disulfide oxidoreductase, FAD/NAD(P)-binding domain protein [Kalmanozyma brasiliensis GHG001]
MMSPAIRAGSLRAMASSSMSLRASRLGMPSTSVAAAVASTAPSSAIASQTRNIFWTRSRKNDKTEAVVKAAASEVQAQLPPPNTNGNGKKKGGFFRKLRRTFYVISIGGLGTYAYFVYQGRHPPEQLPQDPTKKTIVVLGSGWGSTSLLKNIDTEEYNVVVISPHNYFLFTPLLPSVTVGTLDGRSIVQPTRHTTRFKTREVKVYEADCEYIDPVNKTVTFEDSSEVKGSVSKVTIPYDYLVYSVGTENQTFGIEGVKKHACFLKELNDAEKIRGRLIDCVESAAIKGQSEEEIDRLLHMVVVGGGPTGIEYAAELRDFVESDLIRWYPEVANKLRVTLVEALPNILPMFSQTLIKYTESTFKENSIDILTKHMVKDVDDRDVLVKTPSGEDKKIPYGLLVWAAGNTARPLTRQLMASLPEAQKNRRGLEVDDHMRLKGAEDSIFALGDATATQFAPTAQAASQQGAYLARVFNQLARLHVLEDKLATAKKSNADAAELSGLERQIEKAAKIRPFKYSHQGSLAYIGSEKAIADIPLLGNNQIASGGVVTFMFWRSAYMSMLFSLRNRSLVAADWFKVFLFGRDVSRE